MSYIIEIAVPALPDDDRLAWEAAIALRDSQEDEAGKDPVLVRLLDILTAVYPCMSSYPDGDPPLDECPWSDGPLIDNVGSRMAVFGLNGGAQLAVAANDQREDYLRAHLSTRDDGALVATPVSQQDSSLLANLAAAQALLIRPPFAPAEKAGTVCDILKLPV